jgi:hypothetical protein
MGPGPPAYQSGIPPPPELSGKPQQAALTLRLVQRAYRESTRAVGAIICVLGIVMVVLTLARGGGPLALGVIVGVAFAVLGALRVVIANRLTPPGGKT